MSDFPDETHPDIGVPDSPSVPRTRTGWEDHQGRGLGLKERSFLQKVF